MARYLAMAKWNAAGAAGSRAEGFAKRVEVTRKIWESMGATVECVYFAPSTSEWDPIGIVDGVSSDAVYAVGNLVMGTGTVERVGALELRTGEEADIAAAIDIPYRAPGKA
jgi:hypothetical protein